MKYLYYPGCSLKGTGRAYEESLLVVLPRLGIEVQELEQWNCCGATAYMAVDEMKAFALAARNLALAEECGNGDGKPVQMIAPCAACYLVLNKTQRYMREYPEVGKKVGDALRSVQLQYNDHVRVRHPLDVLTHDIGPAKITEAVTRPLDGLKVACYYGCQIVRPFADFDDQHNPQSMETIIKALGAEPIDWPLKTRCCGGSLTGTIQEAGLRLSYILLQEAKKRGADVLVTACPLCQFNLDSYQGQMARQFGTSVNLPAAYFTQLMGLAMGIKPRKLGLHRLTVPLEPAVNARQGALA